MSDNNNEKNKEELENKSNYGADNIQALEGLEAVRKDPACTLVRRTRKVFTIWYGR